MKGFPKVLKTKEDYYNCLAMVAENWQQQICWRKSRAQRTSVILSAA